MTIDSGLHFGVWEFEFPIARLNTKLSLSIFKTYPSLKVYAISLFFILQISFFFLFSVRHSCIASVHPFWYSQELPSSANRVYAVLFIFFNKRYSLCFFYSFSPLPHLRHLWLSHNPLGPLTEEAAIALQTPRLQFADLTNCSLQVRETREKERVREREKKEKSERERER